MSIDIFGQKFFFHFINKEGKARSIENTYSRAEVNRMFPVSWTPRVIPDEFYPEYLGKPFVNELGKPGRLYTVFLSYFHYYEYLKQLLPEDRCFFEIIIGDAHQKIHFDIDLDDYRFLHLSENIKDNLISTTGQVLSELGINLDLERDVLIYTSHDPEGKKKSYHIIIDNYFVKSNRECRHFYNLVTSRMNHDYAKFVDHAVYSGLQNFRLVNCTKVGKQRFKVFNEYFTFRDRTIKNIIEEEGNKNHIILAHSLVSHTNYCKHIQGLTEHVSRRKLRLAGDLGDKAINDAMELLRKRTGDELEEDELESRENIIALRYTGRSYYCPVCLRRHESERPFIFVIGKSVHFDCRRHGLREGVPHRNIHLGFIDSDDIIVNPTEEEMRPEICSVFDGKKPTPKLDGISMNKLMRRKFLTPTIQSDSRKIVFSEPKIMNTFD